MDESAAAGYAHCALFYETPEDLTDALAGFVTDGIARDENVLVVVDDERGQMLRERLASTEGFQLAVSSDVYTSPTRTLAAYIQAVREGTTGGRRMRVAGEPIWAGRSLVELQEWSCVESACNEAFADSMLTMLCPYHVTALHPEIVAAARRTHPMVRTRNRDTVSTEFVQPRRFHRSMRQSPLPPPPPGESTHVPLAGRAVQRARESVDAFAAAASVAAVPRAELVAAVDEVVSAATDGAAADLSIRMWTDVHGLTCDISGRWAVPSDFPGFLRTPMESEGLPGLWTPGQRCDLIAVRERAGVTTVRLRMAPSVDASSDDVSIDVTTAAPTAPSCAEVSELLGVHALGACDADETVAIEVHLAECPACSRELRDLTEVVRAIELAYRPSASIQPDNRTAPHRKGRDAR
jgi:hypothetical protein